MNMIKLFTGFFIFLACMPQVITGCTVTNQQVAATAGMIDLVGKTISEAVKTVGEPIASSVFSTRAGDELGDSFIQKMEYENFTLILQDGIVIRQEPKGKGAE